MSKRILTLGLNNARNDADRARLLSAIVRFAKSTGDSALIEEAEALMPKAHPFKPPQEWLQHYYDAFEAEADEATGTYIEDKERYAIEYWTDLSDEERNKRLQIPKIGLDDGQKDARKLNECDLSE